MLLFLDLDQYQCHKTEPLQCGNLSMQLSLLYQLFCDCFCGVKAGLSTLGLFSTVMLLRSIFSVVGRGQ
ncbi:hypothetical protein Fmac_018429 [Flemingia macrophylla]|uniref:Uncharacterized protein n=1 Tax=Flemingia macrophylla TaxID=520843 RepID=A0ABD1M4Y3_9FABA